MPLTQDVRPVLTAAPAVDAPQANGGAWPAAGRTLGQVVCAHLAAAALALPFLIGLALDSTLLIASPVLTFLLVVPLLDRIIHPASARPNPLASTWAKLAPQTFVALQALCVLAAAATVTLESMALGDILLRGAVLGFLGGVGISASHELVHKTGRDRTVGRFGLLLVFHSHFETTHVYGHHRDAGTLEDPATSRLGESLYAYLWRTVPGQARFVWRRERSRCSTAVATAMRSRVALDLLLYAVALTAAWFVPAIGVVLILHAVGARVLLEAVSFIEHYGLIRAARPSGRPVPTGAEHSWDVYLGASSHLSFMLQRHADHHLHPRRSFVGLETHRQAAELPFGYPLMAAVAFVPPLFRALVHPRLRVHVARFPDSLQPLGDS